MSSPRRRGFQASCNSLGDSRLRGNDGYILTENLTLRVGREFNRKQSQHPVDFPIVCQYHFDEALC